MTRFIPSLSDAQRDILAGLFVKAVAETVAVLVVVWSVVAFVVGSIVLVQWLGRIG